ncbi:valine--tRNA ligase-like [Scylla paramamosain]|uniref:valine--tRNA ligase-like n=1 Tax=Scylla paramamosain TaxID=85552 RepID=UPI00308317B6
MQRETGLCVCLYILTEAFVHPYDAGLVYRKEALVNWCCSLQSAILDIEVDHLHLTGPTELAVPGYSKPVSFGKMWDFPYRLADSAMGALPPRTTTTSTTTPAITYKGETVMWLQVDRFGGLQRAAQSEACGIEGQLLIIKLME